MNNKKAFAIPLLLAFIVAISLKTSLANPPARIGPVILGTLYAKLGGAQECTLYPFSIGNPDDVPIQFDRISIKYEREKSYRGDVIAQDIYIDSKGMMVNLNYMLGMSPDEMKISDNTQLAIQKVKPGMQLNFELTVYGNYQYREDNPSTMVVTLFLKGKPLSTPQAALLPKRSTLTIAPNVKLEGIKGGPGYRLNFKKR